MKFDIKQEILLKAPTTAAHDLASSATRFRIRELPDHHNLSDTFTKNPVSNIRLPYTAAPGCLDFRADNVQKFFQPTNKKWGGAKRLDFALNSSVPPLPNSSVEPYLETARWQLYGREPQEEMVRRQAEDDRARIGRTRRPGHGIVTATSHR